MQCDERILEYKPDRFEPYITADPRADDFWRGSLAAFKRPLVGITWSKYPPAPLLHDLDQALQDWPGTVLSLVWDDQRAELEGNKRIIDAGRHLQSFGALVDLIGKLDFIVAPDGLAMHIAGAMGVPGLVLLTPDKPWYWYAEEGRSYWYPSISVLERKWQEPTDEFGVRNLASRPRFRRRPWFVTRAPQAQYAGSRGYCANAELSDIQRLCHVTTKSYRPNLPSPVVETPSNSASLKIRSRVLPGSPGK